MTMPSLLVAAWCLAAAACIQRTAPPPASATAGAGAEPAVVIKPSAAMEAANARIAALSRVDLLGGASAAAFKVSGDVKKVQATTVPVEGQPFKEALRLAVTQGSDHEWAVQLEAANSAAVEEGDALLATFYLRTETPQEASVGETEFVFELGQSPYTKSIQYPIQADSEWIKVQARFKATRAFRAGEAHMLFRLGYAPEVIQLGGVLVENFGKQVAVNVLPTTQSDDRRRERAMAAIAKKAAQAELSTPPAQGGGLKIEIDTTRVIRAISPYVYGVNSQPGDGVGVTVRRMGGNRGTAYNWELDLSNAGSDYNHQSDDWSCSSMGYRDCSQPGAQYIDFAQANRKAGWETIVSVPLVDYVTADKDGPVAEAEKAPSKRWVRAYLQKPSAYAATPDLKDNAVYEDEFVSYMVQKLGKAAQGGVKFYSLDNEPALWPSTHPRIHAEKTTYKEMVTRSTALASAITKIDPTAQVLGAVAFGWSEYMSLNDAPDARELNAKLGADATYLDVFLASMKRAETEQHRRLIHLLDVHWYPEAKGAKRITDKDTTPKTVAARLQAPRSLWDPTYVEKSWIAATWGKPIRLIPWLKERIAQHYPGTELAMTEYNYGTGDHISGGLAQADILGVFGREGLYLATYWGDGAGNGKLPDYIRAAFQLYRNFDGKGGAFGDTAVAAAPADLGKASVFAATDSKRPGLLTVLVINKELHTIFDGAIDLKVDAKGAPYKRAQVFALDGSGAAVRPLPPIEIKNNQIAYKLPPISATLFVCETR